MMFAYVLKRLGLMIPTLIGITLITFAMVHLAPGDPIALKAQRGADALGGDQAVEAVIADTKKLYGLDQPLYRQYFTWVKRLVTLDFGVSYRDHRPVLEKIADALPITLTLNILTIVIIYIIAIPVGAYTALKPQSFADRLAAVVLFVLYSLPSFWVAMMLITYFAGGDYFNWFPIVGFISDGAAQLPWYGKVANVAWHLCLPVACLTYGGFAFLSRFSRATFIDVIRQDYIRTARAKGCSEWRVVSRHAMRNALVPMVTLMSALLPELLGGSVIVEQIFAIPGMGRLGFESVLARDYPMIMAIATISAVLTLVSILISDLLYAVVDPRISFRSRS